MRLITFQHHGQIRLGAQIGESILDLNKANPALPADIFLLLSAGASALELAREALAEAKPHAFISLSEAILLAPVPHPGKILCIGHNYKGHIGIGKTEIPEYPNFFCKTANTIIGHQQPILVPRVTSQVDYEAELAVIIGKRGHDIPEAEAMDYIAGYSIFNDVSARDIQKRTSQWFLGKSFDTFGPLGPALVTKDEVPDPHCLDLELTVNGAPKQRTNTSDLIFSILFLVSYLSQVMTLDPGDIIATGTPAKLAEASNPQRFLKPGDIVSITIEKLGTLINLIQ
ncbi:MAG: fumarylacetoacetate hydrolase family protein [Anaerolineae bacterium]|nr:fumarylacetoacetate hydrolase family protein [Anaerolineae bacterium]